MTNPYTGRVPQETAWQHGYDYGHEHAHFSTPEAPSFDGWNDYGPEVVATLPGIWHEGAQAGRTAALGHAPTGADASDDGESLPGGVLTPTAGTEPAVIKMKTVKFWLNCFIHDAHVPAPYPAHALNYHHFSGDDRGYSTDIHAPSRLHAEIEIVDLQTGHPHESFHWIMCGPSHALDEHFAVVATDTATPHGGFTNLHYDAATGIVSVHFTGTAAMPLLPSPDVDVNGTFSANVTTGEVSFNGMIDVYPWVEAYAAVNNGSPVNLFQMDPTGTPEGLIGGANRPAHGSAHAPL
ncbi:MAG: hypothetical protein QOH89_1563 [Pseudonocardiales bacterium]|jgi:hypothetical protein|nr:hypothetical protein [Pseudonocardiales bacterium]